MAKVTIAIPCCNEEKFIERTLKCFIGQTEKDIEIYVCDNASTDRTSEIAAEMAREDPRIHLAASPTNIGGRDNFLRSFQLGSAPLFMWAGAHDLFEPEYVEKLVAALEEDKSAILAFSDSGLVGKDGEPIPGDTPFIYPDLSSQDVLERYVRIIWTLSSCVLIHGVMRREWVDLAPMERAKELPDVALLPALALVGPILRVPEVLFFRRLARGFETREENEAHLLDHGYVEKVGNYRDGRCLALRNSLCASIYESGYTSREKRRLVEITHLSLAKRFRVPWEPLEFATIGERMKFFWERIRGRNKKRALRPIERRLLLEHLPQDFGEATLDKRLEVLLAKCREEI